MTAALSILLAFFGPVDGLSSEEYTVREASQAAFTRLSALTLPDNHPDPEARRRILEIKLTLVPHVFPRIAERRLLLSDPAEWISKHVVSGESSLGTKDDAFILFHSDSTYGQAFLRRYPANIEDFGIGDLFGNIAPTNHACFMYRLKYFDNRSPCRSAIIGGLYWSDKPY